MGTTTSSSVAIRRCGAGGAAVGGGGPPGAAAGGGPDTPLWTRLGRPSGQLADVVARARLGADREALPARSFYPRGRVIGGSSAVNAAIAARRAGRLRPVGGVGARGWTPGGVLPFSPVGRRPGREAGPDRDSPRRWMSDPDPARLFQVCHRPASQGRRPTIPKATAKLFPQNRRGRASITAVAYCCRPGTGPTSPSARFAWSTGFLFAGDRAVSATSAWQTSGIRSAGGASPWPPAPSARPRSCCAQVSAPLRWPSWVSNRWRTFRRRRGPDRSPSPGCC